MPLPDLTDDEREELAGLLRDALAADKYFSPRAKRLRGIWGKIDPASTDKAAVAPYPAPKPSGEPSLLYRN